MSNPLTITYVTGEDDYIYARFDCWIGGPFTSKPFVSRELAEMAVRAFFMDLGSNAFIKDGVIGFNVEIEEENG